MKTPQSNRLPTAKNASCRCSGRSARERSTTSSPSIPEPKPKYTTVATFIKILENKGYVAHRSEGKSYVFTPLVSREEVAGRQMQSMLRTYFDGSFAQMVTFFSKHENISMKEMDEILSVMQQIRKKR